MPNASIRVKEWKTEAEVLETTKQIAESDLTLAFGMRPSNLITQRFEGEDLINWLVTKVSNNFHFFVIKKTYKWGSVNWEILDYFENGSEAQQNADEIEFALGKENTINNSLDSLINSLVKSYADIYTADALDMVSRELNKRIEQAHLIRPRRS
jgi:hypothetical protein